jgi:phosphoglycerate kinase
MAIPSIDDLDVAGKRVLLRVDINSPIDPATGAITDENRIDQSLATIRDLADRKARLVIIAHQGDTLDYHNLVGLGQHAVRLAVKLGRPVGFVDDVAGPAARDPSPRSAAEILLLDNLRYLTEEVSAFGDMTHPQADGGPTWCRTWLRCSACTRRLPPPVGVAS